jgi:signal transduction histidine kinase
MPEGGRLDIDAHLIRDSIEVSIKDTGVGIPPENLTKIFQPLFTTKTKGIGLGLVVCKNLVEANGGSIRVESEEGKGTVFYIALTRE